MSGSGAARGWAAVVALTLAAALLAVPVVTPVLLIFVPFGLLLLAEGPERLGTALVGAVMLAIALAGSPAGPFWYFERGWALVLGAWFVLGGAVRPGLRFLPRALASIVAAALTSAAIFAIGGGWLGLDSVIATEYREAGAQGAAFFRQLQSGATAADLGSAWERAAAIQAVIYPALVALGSLAALAVAWWGARRLIHREAQPLGALREFRFNDELVWTVIAGLALWLLPLGAAAHRIGLNALTFMAGLYALRGAAVLLSMLGAIRPLGAVLGVAVVVLLYPFVMSAALVVGLTDTWLDFRTRRREANGVS